MKTKFVAINDAVSEIIRLSKEMNKIKNTSKNLMHTKTQLVSVLGSLFPVDTFMSVTNKLETRKKIIMHNLREHSQNLLSISGMHEVLDPEDFVMSTKDLKAGYCTLDGKNNKSYYFSLNTGDFFLKEHTDEEESKETMPDIIKEAYSVIDDDIVYSRFFVDRN